VGQERHRMTGEPLNGILVPLLQVWLYASRNARMRKAARPAPAPAHRTTLRTMSAHAELGMSANRSQGWSLSAARGWAACQDQRQGQERPQPVASSRSGRYLQTPDSATAVCALLREDRF